MKPIFTRNCDCGRATVNGNLGLAPGTKLCTCSFQTRTRWSGAAARLFSAGHWPSIRY